MGVCTWTVTQAFQSTCVYTQQVLLLQSTQSSPFMLPPSHPPYLQELSSGIGEAELPQHADLDLVADGGALPTVQSVGALHLLRVPQLLQPPDHLLHYQETGNCTDNRECRGDKREAFLSTVRQ